MATVTIDPGISVHAHVLRVCMCVVCSPFKRINYPPMNVSSINPAINLEDQEKRERGKRAGGQSDREKKEEEIEER